VAEVAARNAVLEREVRALGAENAVLRAATLGFRPWTGTVQLRHAGGSGGVAPYARACPAGEAVSGIRGRGGSLLDAVAPVCTRLDPGDLRGLTDASPVETELEPAGGGGGAAFARSCAAGAHVVGVRGRGGDLIDALELLCLDARAAASAAATPGAKPVAATSLPVAGGTGGQPFERRCPQGWVVVGFSGRYDRQVNSIALHCGKAGGE
jgi:hypothetical protein